MKCNVCGLENVEEAKFCAGCGAKLLEEVTPEVVKQQEEPHVPKCFDIFAKLGFGLGLGGLIGCIFIGLGYIVAAPGIVFSILGKRSIKFRDKANKGLVLSIIGTVVGFIIYFLFFFIIGLIAGLEGDPYMYY